MQVTPDDQLITANMYLLQLLTDRGYINDRVILTPQRLQEVILARNPNLNLEGYLATYQAQIAPDYYDQVITDVPLVVQIVWTNLMADILGISVAEILTRRYPAAAPDDPGVQVIFTEPEPEKARKVTLAKKSIDVENLEVRVGSRYPVRMALNEVEPVSGKDAARRIIFTIIRGNPQLDTDIRQLLLLRYPPRRTQNIIKYVDGLLSIVLEYSTLDNPPPDPDKGTRDLIKDMIRTGLANQTTILVQSNKLTGQAKLVLKLFQQSIYTHKLEIFLASELSYNPIQHILQPHIRVISPEQRLELGAGLAQLPLLLRQDPVVRHYGLSPGVLVEFERSDVEVNPLTGEHIQHRVVV